MKSGARKKVLLAMAALSILMCGNPVSVLAEDIALDEFTAGEVAQEEKEIIEEDAGFFSDEELELGESEETDAVFSAGDGSDESVSIKSEVASISVNMGITRLSEKIDGAYLKNSEITFNCSWGYLPPVSCTDNSRTFADADGNNYTYYWQEASDPAGTRYQAGSALKPGTYRLIITGSDGDIPLDKEYTIEVTALDTPAMKVGVNKNVQTPKDRYAWYSFTPSQTGDYAWHRIQNIKVIKAAPDGPEKVEYKTVGYKCMFRLEKDCVYYVGFKGGIWTGTDASDEVQHFEFDITLYQCDTVVSAAILEKNLINEVYVEGAAYITEETGDIRVTYADGHTEIAKKRGPAEQRMDSSGNEFRLYYKDSDGNIYVHYSYLKKGTYTAVVCCNGYVVDTIDAPVFKILPAREVSQGVLKEGVNKNIRSKGNWYTFTPKKSGKYGFYMDQEPDIYTLNSKGKLRWMGKRTSYSDDRRVTKYPLQKGVTYYIEFHNGGFFRGVDSKGNAIMDEIGNVTIKIKNDCKKGHTFNPYYDRITKKATYSKAGTKESFCVDCGKTFTKTIPVLKKIETRKITGLKDKVTVKKGARLTLNPVLTPADSQEKIVYSSSNEKVAAVSKNGVISGKKKGTAYITVKSGKAAKKIKVTVK